MERSISSPIILVQCLDEHFSIHIIETIHLQKDVTWILPTEYKHIHNRSLYAVLHVLSYFTPFNIWHPSVGCRFGLPFKSHTSIINSLLYNIEYIFVVHPLWHGEFSPASTSFLRKPKPIIFRVLNNALCYTAVETLRLSPNFRVIDGFSSVNEDNHHVHHCFKINWSFTGWF